MISVIVPMFNSYNFIEQSINQLKCQTFKDFEALYIENGSNDERDKRLIESLSDNRFKYFHIDAKGVSNARNFGLRISKGQFVSFIDVDDQISPNYLMSLHSSITSNNSDIALCNYYEVEGNKEKEIKLPDEGDVVYNHSFIVNKLIPSFTNCNIFHSPFTMGVVWRSLFRKEFLDINRLSFDRKLTIAEDLVFCIDSYSKAKSISHVNLPLYKYIIHSDSSLGTKKKRSYVDEGKYFNTIIRNKLRRIGIEYRESKVNSYIFGTYTRAVEIAADNNRLHEISEICDWFIADYKTNPFSKDELISRKRKLIFPLLLRKKVFLIFLLCKIRNIYFVR